MDSDALFVMGTSLDGGPVESAATLNAGVEVAATDLARGPWDPGALHGGPVSSLLALAVESQDPHAAFVVARLTVELERVVPPHRRLTLSAQVLRPGRKVQLVEALLSDEGKVLARARAMCIRRGDVRLPDAVLPGDPAPTSEGSYQPPDMTASYDGFHNAANEFRFVEGSWADRGPVVVWVRLKYPLIAGLTMSPLQRVAAAADFGNGVSAILPWENFTYINPDLTIHQLRPLVGEWVGMRVKSHVATNGVGFAESELFDSHGRVGRSVQSLLVEQRD